MLKLLALATVLATTACTIDQPEDEIMVFARRDTNVTGESRVELDTQDMAAPMHVRPTDKLEQSAATDEARERELPADFCDHLPTDGACAFACDVEALEQYIPAGSCVLMTCTLDTGETFKTGGCHL
jgi:hypothetical protein